MKTTKNFYDEDYIPHRTPIKATGVNLNNPCEIYGYLMQNVYKQDAYCKKAAMLLFNHIKGRRSRIIVAGPPGSGKTLVAENIKKLWPKTIIVNAATLTKEGFVGENKVSTFLEQVNPSEDDYIIVFDEFDKLVAPSYSRGENVSASIQSEFLKLVEGDDVACGLKERRRYVSTANMSFIFCGSFAVMAKEMAEKNSVKTIGFLAEEHIENAFDKELTMDDIIEFGLIPEIASRCTDIINVRPLTLKDYEFLLTDHPASPLSKIEEEYQVKIKITKKQLKAIAKEAYESQLGVRYAASKLRRMVDSEIFSSFEKTGEDIAFISI